MPGHGYKFLRFFAFEKLLKRRFVDVTELPFVENVEVAWEDASVSLGNKIAGASAAHGAVFGWISHKNANVIVEIAYAYVITFHKVAVVFIESGA